MGRTKRTTRRYHQLDKLGSVESADLQPLNNIFYEISQKLQRLEGRAGTIPLKDSLQIDTEDANLIEFKNWGTIARFGKNQKALAIGAGAIKVNAATAEEEDTWKAVGSDAVIVEIGSQPVSGTAGLTSAVKIYFERNLEVDTAFSPYLGTTLTENHLIWGNPDSPLGTPYQATGTLEWAIPATWKFYGDQTVNQELRLYKQGPNSSPSESMGIGYHAGATDFMLATYYSGGGVRQAIRVGTVTNYCRFSASDEFYPGPNATWDLGKTSFNWKSLYTGAVRSDGNLLIAPVGGKTDHLGDLDPQIGGSYDLGDATLYWQEGWFNKVLVGNGTQIAPSFTFRSDTDTGMLRPNTNQVSLAAGGKQIFLVTQDGSDSNMYQYEPAASSNYFRWHMNSTGYMYMSLHKGASGTDQNIYFRNTTNGNIRLGTNGTDRWVIQTSGDLDPLADSVYDIGSSTSAIDNLYINGSIYADDAGGTNRDLGAPVGSNYSCYLYRTAVQSISNNTETAITWTNQLYDAGNMWSSGATITVPIDGQYLIIFNYQFQNINDQDKVYGTLSINGGGSGGKSEQHVSFPSATAYPAGNIAVVRNMSASDTIQARVLQAYGSARNIDASNTRIMVKRIGDKI
jgi:hypothetical protein